MFFELNISLCERFPALDPFTVRQMRANEVFLIVKRLNNRTNTVKRDKRGRVRKQADDSWF